MANLLKSYRQIFCIILFVMALMPPFTNAQKEEDEDTDSTDEDADVEDGCEWSPCKFKDSDQLKCRNGCRIAEIDGQKCHYDDFARYKCCC